MRARAKHILHCAVSPVDLLPGTGLEVGPEEFAAALDRVKFTIVDSSDPGVGPVIWITDLGSASRGVYGEKAAVKVDRVNAGRAWP